MSIHYIAFNNLNTVDCDVIRQGVLQQLPKLTIQDDIDDKTSLIIGCQIQPDIPILKIGSAPIRIGVILDEVEAQLYTKNNHDIACGVYHLSTKDQILKIGSTTIPLTETEYNIVAEILSANNTECTRDHLLKTIWGYVDGIETHTLETHIYRLRQKIETEPDVPKHLITTEDGYKINEP